MLEANAIVLNTAKYIILVLAEGALPKSSARAKFSNVAQHWDNGSRVTLSYDDAAESKQKGTTKGHTPSRVTTHNDNELTKH